VKKNATAAGPLGPGLDAQQHRRRRRLQGRGLPPGQEIVYVRYDDWKSGPLPKLRRIIQRDVPNAGNRRALLVKGDIDITYDLPPKDFGELASRGRGGQGDQHADRERDVLPGHERHQAALRQPQGAPGRGLRAALRQDVRQRACTAAASSSTAQASNPRPPPGRRPTGYKTDIAKAKALMAEAGFPNGFETTLSASTWAAPRSANRWPS
jgi:peptide/nickel transport system substrate-binding protein